MKKIGVYASPVEKKEISGVVIGVWWGVQREREDELWFTVVTAFDELVSFEMGGHFSTKCVNLGQGAVKLPSKFLFCFFRQEWVLLGGKSGLYYFFFSLNVWVSERYQNELLISRFPEINFIKVILKSTLLKFNGLLKI